MKSATTGWKKVPTAARPNQLQKTFDKRWRLSVFQNAENGFWCWFLEEFQLIQWVFRKRGDSGTRRMAQIRATQALEDKLRHEAILEGKP